MSFVNGLRDVRIMIEEALENLTEQEDGKDRILFDLIAVHNYTYNQAGIELDLTYKQVRTIFNKMVRKLTDYLKERGIKTLEDLL